ncbi:MAG: glycosyltransferase [bacterium]|nr:glycosyltransferase [bacterium]
MKVLLSFPMGDKQTGVYIKRAFESLGCEICIVDPKFEYKNLISASKEFSPDFLFCSREEELVDVIKDYRKECPGVKTVCYNVDARHSVKEWGRLLKLFDSVHLYYCKPRGNVAESQKLCPNTIVKFLTEGMDLTEHKKEILTEGDFEKYGYDVVFAGSKSEIYKTPRTYGRIGLIEYLQNKGVNLKLISFNIHGMEKSLGEDHNKICQCSKIVLGHCGWADVDLANSARDFRVTAAGGFLLTEYVRGMESLFEIGKECETYRTPEECYEKIKYYLTHDEERKQIAENGYQRTIKDHTFKNRMLIVLNDIEKIKL